MSATASPQPMRLVWVITGMLGIYLLAHLLGFADLLSPDYLRSLVSQAGPWGPLVFAGVFVGGVLAQIPGMVFLAAAPLLFPIAVAVPLCLVAGNVAVNVNFALVRRIGGQSLTQFEQPWAQRIFHQLETRPLWAVSMLRMVLIMFPPLTGALALTSLSAKDHATGSALGMLLPISLIIVIESLALG